MRWRRKRRSSNVEDRRGGGRTRKYAMGGCLATIVILGLSWFTGINLTPFLQFFGGGEMVTTTQTGQPDPREDATAQLVSVVLASTEDVWGGIFNAQGQRYQAPTLVLFDYQTTSACGFASKATGPFYCPGDHKVYIDLDFCRVLKSRFHAPGEFAIAYVIAHEVGHHIQNLLGITDMVESQRNSLSESQFNRLSVKLELQADFLAGVWGYYARNNQHMLEEGDLESALRAAHSLGDDKIQMRARGYVVPESFTHGTAAQRAYWFKKGFMSGDLAQGSFKTIGTLGIQ